MILFSHGTRSNGDDVEDEKIWIWSVDGGVWNSGGQVWDVGSEEVESVELWNVAWKRRLLAVVAVD